MHLVWLELTHWQTLSIISNIFPITCTLPNKRHEPSLKQEAHGPHRSPEKSVQINEFILSKAMIQINLSWNLLSSSGENFEISWLYFYNFVFISLWKKARTFNMNKLKSSSQKDAFYQSLVEIGTLVLEKIFWFLCFFAIR